MSQSESQRGEASFRALVIAASIAVFAVLLLAGYDGSRDLARLKAREAQLEGRLRRSAAEITTLRDRIGRLRTDPHSLERVAREQLGLTRPGEIVVVLPRVAIEPAANEPTASKP